MNRRSFVLKTTAAAASLPISALLFKSAIAKADDNSGWFELPGTNGGIKVKSLWKEGTAEGALYQFAPNFPLGPHAHPAGEYTYGISGELSTQGILNGLRKKIAGPSTLVAGGYGYAAPGTIHLPGQVGAEGATIFVFTPVPIDLTIKL